MKPMDSIRARLSRSYLLFFFLVLMLGAVSIVMVSYENDLSAEIRDIWLQNTRYIGDFENFTSDYRADEGSLLLSSTAAEITGNEDDMANLDRQVSVTQKEFERIPHDEVETALYRQFKDQWWAYKAAKQQVYFRFKAGDLSYAVRLYQTISQTTYNSLSDTLEKLRTYNINKAQAASRKSKLASNNIIILITIAVMMTGSVALLTLLYIRRSTFNPLIELITKMQLLAKNDTHIEVDGLERTDEIGEMARAVMLFKNNIIALDKSKTAIERQAAYLLEKIEEDQQLAMHQRNFVSMASHEFRTPLHIIDGQAQRLLRHKDAASDTELDRRVGEIRAAVLRMTHLIDTLLNAARLMDGVTELYLQPEELDLAALLRDVCRQHREISPHAQIRESFGKSRLLCICDYRLIFQAFSNVIGNAIKYAKNDNVLKVTAVRKDNHVIVTVADSGIGIPEADMEHVFERFYRGSNVSGVVGTGLGLYLVKMVVERHGGDIAVKSKVGGGTEFKITLPLEQEPARSDMEKRVSMSNIKH